MINSFYSRAGAGCLAALLAGVAPGFAVPKLQLDVSPGLYDTVTETTVATANPFTLRALIDGSLGLSRTYYLSAAIVPGTSGTAFGSFNIGGIEYSSSLGNMQYGVPPVDNGGLPTHGIYPTWYAELSFTIDQANLINSYNVQDGSAGPGSLYYVDFAVNIAALFGEPNSPYGLHFDLYTYDTITKKNGAIGKKIDAFAPFSHDAGSGHGLTIIEQAPPVPDAYSTLTLLTLGFLGLGAVRRRLNV